VRELLAGIDARELSEWMAYDGSQWLPDRRLEYLLALLAAITLNVHGDGKRVVRVAELMPWLEEEEAPAPRDLTARIVELNALFGGSDQRGRGHAGDD